MKLVALQVEWKGKLRTGKQEVMPLASILLWFLKCIVIETNVFYFFLPSRREALPDSRNGKISHLNVR